LARTVATAVEGILGEHYDSGNSPSLTPFINTATAVVDQVSTCATARGTTVSSATLELIERWLAAHFYTISDPIAQQKKTGEASAVFQGKTGLGLDGTSYGQNAMTLDHSGCLRTMSRGRKATVGWLGRPPSEQTDYVDRD
jgi:hypothetical protein